jgi:Rod binding domain-containing protein
MSLPVTALAMPAAKIAIGMATKAVGQLAQALSPAEAKIRKTADDFETMYLENMLQQVFPQDSGEGPLGNNGPGSDVWKGMLVNEYARGVSKSGGLGISDTIYRQMLQMQEQQMGGQQMGGRRGA